MNILVEVTPRNAGTPETVLMSALGSDASGTIVDGKTWLPAITGWNSQNASFANAGLPTPRQVGNGAITFRIAPELANQHWSGWEWHGAPIKVWVGQAGDPLSAYTRILTGVAGNLDRTGNTATLELLGSDTLLDKPLLPLTYLGTGGVENVASAKGKLKKRLFGEPIAVEPDLINVEKVIYQVDGYRAAQSIDVWIFGFALGADKRKPDQPDYDALAALTLAPGEWATCLARGMFRLAALPQKKMTADVVMAGDSLADYVRRLLTIAEVPAAQIGDLTAWQSIRYSAVHNDATTVREALMDAAHQAGGYLIPDGSGVWRIGSNFATKTPRVLNGDGSTLPLVLDVEELAAPAPVWKVDVTYNRCWSVHQTSDLSPLITPTSNWSEIIDDDGRKPADNADVTADNTSKDTAAVDGKPATEVKQELSETKTALTNPTTQQLIKVSDILTDVTDLQATYGNTISSSAAKTAAEAARDAARLAQDNAIVASTDAAGSILSPGLSPQAWTYDEWNLFAPTHPSLRKSSGDPGTPFSLVNGKLRVAGGRHVHPYLPQPIDPLRTYRIAFRGRVVASGSHSSGHSLYVTFWDKDGNLLAGNTVLVAGKGHAEVPLNTTFVLESIRTPADLVGPTAAFARVMYRTISDGTTEIDQLYLEDVDAATKAAGSATASAGSAATAKTQADNAQGSAEEAGRQASAARSAYDDAVIETSRAKGHADNAESSASAADQSSSSALRSERTAAGYSATRGLTPNGTFQEGVVGTTTVPGWRHASGSPYVYGQHYSGLGIRTTGHTDFFSAQRVRVDTSRTYRLKGTYVVHAPADNTIYFGLACFNAAGSHIGNAYVTPADGVPYPGTPNAVHHFSSDYTGEADFVYAHSRRFIRGTVYVEILGFLNYPEGRPNAPTEVNELYLEDVTNAVESAANAIVARDQAANATRDAAIASTSAIVAAQVSSQGVNRGGTFTGWPDGQASPTYWQPWANGGAYRVDGRVGRYAAEIDALEAREWGLEANWNTDPGLANITPGGWWVMEADVELLHGQLGGAGLHCHFYAPGGHATGQAFNLSFAHDADATGTVRGAGVAGQRYTFSRILKDGSTNGTMLAFYAMASWGGFPGANLFYKRIRFHKAIIRPATQAEIELERPSTGIKAQVGTVTTAVTDGRFAAASTVTQLRTEYNGTASTVSQNVGAINTLNGRNRAWMDSTVESGTGRAIVSLRADGQTGSSNIDLAATNIRLLNPANGGYVPALSVQNGNATFSGGLSAGAYIRLGNQVQWPVALQTRNFSAVDGEQVNYGVDVGGLPRLTFSPVGLAPLNQGETYQLSADNLTSTGFIARLRIGIPGTVTDYSVSSNSVSSARPTNRVERAGNPEAQSGNYRFQLGVSGRVQNFQQGEPGSLTAYISIWVRKAGVWQAVGSTGVNAYGDFGGATTQYYVTSDDIYTLGAGAEAFGASVDHVEGGTASININSVSWQSQTSSASTRSASPNGERAIIQVSPQ